MSLSRYSHLAKQLFPMKEIVEIVGDLYVKTDEQTLARYSRSTHGTPSWPLAVVWPSNRSEVCQIVRLVEEANIQIKSEGGEGTGQIGIYPISCGKNYGYGDAAPVQGVSGTEDQNEGGSVVMDLGRMNRIVEVNEEMGYAVIEPGVTQGQLYDFLSHHHPDLWMDATGAGLASSFVGNTLDRGFGHTRYGDHFLSTCSMEVVLADGRVLNTGYGHYENAKAKRAYRYGIGPYLDGLFAQSNMGIVTQIGLWLMPAPEAFSAFFFAVDTQEDVLALIDRLSKLRMQGLLQSTIHIANDLRTISAKMRYPWERAGGKTPLPKELRAALRGELGIGAWNGCGAIYGTRGTVRATQKTLAKALKGICGGGRGRLAFLDDRKLALAHGVRRALGIVGAGRKLQDLLETVEPVYGLLKGVPNDDALKGAAWRVRDPDPGHPVDLMDAHAGIMWVSPVVPAQGSAAKEVLAIVEPIYERYGFEALITFTMITERAMCCVTNLAFDVRETEEVARAQACYNELMPALMAAGYQPYRTGPHGFKKLATGSSVFWDVVKSLKETMDPQGMISPGRYEAW